MITASVKPHDVCNSTFHHQNMFTVSVIKVQLESAHAETFPCQPFKAVMTEV